MLQRKLLFIDRDGTLINEPEDKQIDSLEKLQLVDDVIVNLLALKNAGFSFILVSNQDGLGTDSFPQEDFEKPQNKLLDILASQGISFDDILVCPHFDKDNCECRKPKVGLVLNYLRDTTWDRTQSYVIGDRQTDIDLAKNMGIKGILYSNKNNWNAITDQLTRVDRCATITRNTKETKIEVKLNLDQQGTIEIDTGIGFFDHMLEQIAKHGGFNLNLSVQGDLEIDEHHTVEDTALALGQALSQALSDKRGINRYGFLLPMDEAQCQIALDLSGRPYFIFEGSFNREMIGELPTELVPHFFRSLAESLGANLHISVKGENAHHMVEGIFKGVGRCLKQAIAQEGYELPSTKGVL